MSPKRNSFRNLLSVHKIDLNISWIPREENVKAGALIKQIDYDDLFITFKLVTLLTNKWSNISIGRLVSHINNKTDTFNSKYTRPGPEDVNAFSTD